MEEDEAEPTRTALSHMFSSLVLLLSLLGSFSVSVEMAWTAPSSPDLHVSHGEEVTTKWAVSSMVGKCGVGGGVHTISRKDGRFGVSCVSLQSHTPAHTLTASFSFLSPSSCQVSRSS